VPLETAREPFESRQDRAQPAGIPNRDILRRDNVRIASETGQADWVLTCARAARVLAGPLVDLGAAHPTAGPCSSAARPPQEI
jgi:hypothetical protein